MTQQHPDPLVPAEVDLRDFAFMPLDVVRLRDSDLAAMEAPDACWAAVLLWCASWHQVPAASVPDDDRVLANLAGFGRVVKEWQKVREGALRGWVRCSDGRLYHPVVAEKALDAWRSKLEQRWRTECARIKKHGDRHGIKLDRPEFDEWISLGCPQGHPLPVPRDTEHESPGTTRRSPSNVPRETASKGQGEGQGQGINKREKPRTADSTDAVRGPVDPPEPPGNPTPAGLICRALRGAGMADTNPGHPDLLALIAAGTTPEEFAGAGAEAIRRGKGFAYAIGTLKRQRTEAAAMAQGLHQGAMPARAPTAAELRVLQAVPSLAAPHLRPTAPTPTTTILEADDVAPKRLG